MLAGLSVKAAESVLGQPRIMFLVTNFACELGQRHHGSINKIDATHPHNWNTVSNLCVCGVATHHITRFGAIPISSYICAGVSKVGGKLTLPCTRKVLNKIGSTGSKSHRQLLLMLVVLLLSVRVSTKSTDHIKQYFIKVGMWLYCGYSLSFTLVFYDSFFHTISCQWIGSKISSPNGERCESSWLSHIYHSNLDVRYSFLLLSTFDKSVDVSRSKRLWLRLCGTHSQRAVLHVQFDVGRSVSVGGSWKPFRRLALIRGRCHTFCMCTEAASLTMVQRSFTAPIHIIGKAISSLHSPHH